MVEEKIVVTPDVCEHVDNQHKKLIIEATISGVKRKDINGIHRVFEHLNILLPREARGGKKD